jgi:transcriptional regulator with XRE-family HTH domain
VLELQLPPAAAQTTGNCSRWITAQSKHKKLPLKTARKNMKEKENKKKPNPTDIHVGSRIRLRRNMLGMSQEKLGENLGITFQQVQKYEKGTNRVGASRLQAIASILDVPVSFFFAEAPGRESAEVTGMSEGKSAHFVVDFVSSAEGLQLNRAFARITEPKIRRRIIDLVKALAADDSE